MLLPVIGTLLFFILYIIAACYYPGGSQADANSTGFSWVNNYFCNLLSEIAINGQVNTARPIALTAMIVVCLTLSLFWFIFPLFADISKSSKLIIQISGISAMISAMFIFTELHDLVIDISGLLGLVALVGTFRALYKMDNYKMLIWGIVNLLLVALNNYIYYTKWQYACLPMIQKITFLSFLLWICSININLYRKKINLNFK